MDSNSELLPLFRKPRREQRRRVFSKWDWFMFGSFLYLCVMPNALNLLSRFCAYLFDCRNAWYNESELVTCQLRGVKMTAFMTVLVKLEELTLTAGLVTTVFLYVPVLVLVVLMGRNRNAANK